MHKLALSKVKTGAIPIWAISPVDLKKLHTIVGKDDAAWANLNGFKANKGQMLLLQNSDNKIASVLFGLGKSPQSMDFGALPNQLPEGDFYLASEISDMHLAALGWCLGAYRFDRYKTKAPAKARLAISQSISGSVERAALATFLCRDLINTPTNDLGPQQLETAVRNLARTHKARVSVTRGDALLKKNFPMIHAVGRASHDAPRLIDLKWGNKAHRKITLVGKGVCFDTGGLNIKPGNSMTLMKKDMGGAANVIALAQMIMDAKLPVCLRVLIPAVENSISANAFRPGDILPSRKGISVEIGNTDAEGRLVLADALCLADEEAPDLLIDMATLTGAARVALGPDLSPFYTHNSALAHQITRAANTNQDPLWRMPLWEPYQTMLSSTIADVNHITAGGFAGSITAALFLSRFVEKANDWVHLDVFGWVPAKKPWAPIGGEAQGIRALFEVISERSKS